MSKFDELDTDEPLDKRIERHAYDRLIVLADGVFAFAATLLALEVKIPPNWTGSLDTLITTATVSAAIGYVISFLVVGIYWMGNRRIMALLTRVDGTVTFVTLILLMLIALLPTISRTLVTDDGRISQSSVIYVGYVTLIGLMQAGLWFYGAFVAKLAHPSLEKAYKVRLLIWMLVVPTAASGMAMLSISEIRGPWGYVGVFAIMTTMVVLRSRVLKR